jgi:hypothetical protein
MLENLLETVLKFAPSLISKGEISLFICGLDSCYLGGLQFDSWKLQNRLFDIVMPKRPI